MASPCATDRSVSLWVRPGPLDSGVIGPYERQSGEQRFSLSTLKKLLAYTRSKAKDGYPHLSYSIWMNIAVNKLGMSEQLSWLYFETFDLVSDISLSDRRQLIEVMAKCKGTEDISFMRRQIAVSTLQFVLFLYIQSAPRLSLKAPMMSGEEWPSPESEKRLKSSEYAHLSFVKSHICDLLELLATPSGTGEGEGEEERVSMEAVKALEFLLSSSLSHKDTTPLSEVVSSHPHASTCGFSKARQSFSKVQLEQWLKTYISLDPFGARWLKSGIRDPICHYFQSDKRGKVASNILSAPPRCGYTLLNRVNNQTIAKGEESFEGSHVVVEYCRGSNIYLLAPLKAVQIQKCSRCLLFVGAVETTVSVGHCDRVTIIAACRRLHVSTSSMCSFHLLTPTSPIVFPACQNLTFAPYNSFYPALGCHLTQAALSPDISSWDSPLILGGSGDGGDTTAVWKIMTPEDFRPFVVPFKIEGDTKENPYHLPKQFQDELTQRKRRISQWYKVLADAHLSGEQEAQLQERVQAKFEEWLAHTGHRKDISDLEVKTNAPL